MRLAGFLLQEVDAMKLTSLSFAESQEMPQRLGKREENISPELSWSDPPPGTQSYALSVVDTDPVARGYVHWLVADIPADAHSLKEGAADGAMPLGSREVNPYAGPFPPSGTHDYQFTLYALDAATVDVPRDASLQQFREAVEPHALSSAKLIGKFTKA